MGPAIGWSYGPTRDVSEELTLQVGGREPECVDLLFLGLVYIYIAK